MSSISQNNSNEVALLDCVQKFFIKHHVGRLLKQCNGTKEKGVSAVSLLKYKMGNIFTGRSMYMQQKTGSFKEAFSKNTFYRFLNSTKTNWLRFTSLLAADIVKNDLKHLTDDSRKNVFIIDDSLFHRTSCKKTELGSKVFDHTGMNYKKGFRMLTVSWSDGNTLIPVNSCRNYYEILLNEGKTKEEALEILAARSRDNSRTPMQWTDERYCGFSDTKPWIPVSDNFEKINVKKQKQDRDSILEFYKKLIMLRKEKEVIARGNIEFMEVENAGVLAYTRCLDKQKLLVCCNFRDVESQMEFTQEWKSGRKILGNYEENHKNNYKVLTLRPYEIIVLEKGEE